MSTPSPFADITAASTGTSGWVACSFDDVTLLIPSSDVGERVAGDEIEVSNGDGLEVGWLTLDDGRWPVYRLDRDLMPVVWDQKATATVVPIIANRKARGILCDLVRVFNHADAVTVHPMPGCLQREGSPIAGLGLYETLRVGAVVHGEDFLRYLDTPWERSEQ